MTIFYLLVFLMFFFYCFQSLHFVTNIKAKICLHSNTYYYLFLNNLKHLQRIYFFVIVWNVFVFQFQSKYLSITLYFCLFTFLNWRNSKHTTDVLWVKESNLRPKDVFISMTLQSRCQLLDSKNINSENLLETDFHFQQLKTLKPQNNQWFSNSLNCLFCRV